MLDDQLLLTLGARYQKFDFANFAYGTAEQLDRYEESRTSPLVGARLPAAARRSRSTATTSRG